MLIIGSRQNYSQMFWSLCEHIIYMLVACSYFPRRYRSGLHRLISLIMWTIHLMLKTELSQSSSSSSFYFIMLEMRLTGIGYWLLLEQFTYMALWNTWFWLVNRGIQRSDIFSCSLSSMEMLYKKLMKLALLSCLSYCTTPWMCSLGSHKCNWWYLYLSNQSENTYCNKTDYCVYCNELFLVTLYFDAL